MDAQHPPCSPRCPGGLGSAAVANPALLPPCPEPSHSGECLLQSQLLVSSYIQDAAMPDHPCHMQGRGLLATGHNLVPTSCQELPPHSTAVPPQLPWVSTPQPMPWSRSWDQDKKAQSLWSWHPGCFPQTLAYLLETGVLCSVDYAGLTQFAQTQLLSCSKGPPRAL